MEIQKYKIILVGDSNVGKTSIMNSYLKKKKKYVTSTIGTEFSNIFMKEKNQEFQVWDCAGQEKYRSLVKLYYRGAKVCLFVFDLNNMNSLYSINNYWMKIVKENVEEKCVFYLIGNKNDLENKIYKEVVDELCELYNMDYIECSASKDINIKLIFEKISGLLYGEKILNIKDSFENKLVKIKNEDIKKERYNIYGYC